MNKIKVFYLPAQMRATTDDKFHTRPNMPRATAFLWVHESHASRNRRIQKFALSHQQWKLVQWNQN